MKVLHIEDRFHPGMGYQINFFARYHNPDQDFFILSSDSARLWSASEDDVDLHSVDAEFERTNKVSIVRLPVAMDRRNRQNLWLKGLIRAIHQINPDILYVHTIETYTALRVLLNKKTLSRYRVFFDTHTLRNQFQSGWKFKVHLWFLRNIASKRITKYDAKVFATVPENKIILEQDYGIASDRILYSPIGTDTSIFSFDPDWRIRLREADRVGEKDTVLLYTGKLNSRKNPHRILEAVKLLEDKIKAPIHLIFVGAADKAYQDEKMDFGFSNENIYVKFVPAVPVSELNRWYSMADFAVFPDENTLSAMDAQLCALPVIMQDDMTNSERLERGGLTFAKDDLKNLSEKILWMIANPEKRKKMGMDGQEHIKAKFDYRRIVEKMEADLRNE